MKADILMTNTKNVAS